MTKNVFIAGHGRMKPSGRDLTVPSGVTLHWAVAAGYNNTGGVSRALLKGDFTTWAETKTAGEIYKEHYLVPDSNMIMQTKGQAIFDRKNKTDDYLLQPRLDFVTTLSALIGYLTTKLGTPLNIYWTCCRSPINELSKGNVFLQGNGTVVKPKNQAEIVKHPKNDAVAGDIIKTTKAGTGAVSRGSSVRKTETLDGIACINAIDGAVVLVKATDKAVKLAATWQDKTVMGSEGNALDLAR
jgi:hypothetical protein